MDMTGFLRIYSNLVWGRTIVQCDPMEAHSSEVVIPLPEKLKNRNLDGGIVSGVISGESLVLKVLPEPPAEKKRDASFFEDWIKDPSIPEFELTPELRADPRAMAILKMVIDAVVFRGQCNLLRGMALDHEHLLHCQ